MIFCFSFCLIPTKTYITIIRSRLQLFIIYDFVRVVTKDFPNIVRVVMSGQVAPAFEPFRGAAFGAVGVGGDEADKPVLQQAVDKFWYRIEELRNNGDGVDLQVDAVADEVAAALRFLHETVVALAVSEDRFKVFVGDFAKTVEDVVVLFVRVELDETIVGIGEGHDFFVGEALRQGAVIEQLVAGVEFKIIPVVEADCLQFIKTADHALGGDTVVRHILMRRDNDGVTVIFCGDFQHGQGHVHVLGAVIYARKDVDVHVDEAVVGEVAHDFSNPLKTNVSLH